MSQFVVCEKCGSHAIRGVNTCNNCGNVLSKVKIVAVGRVENSKSENIKQGIKQQFSK